MFIEFASINKVKMIKKLIKMQNIICKNKKNMNRVKFYEKNEHMFKFQLNVWVASLES